MYTKEELEKLSIPELLEIASELGVKVSQNDELENVIYAILDKAAENSAAGVSETKRKRTRIAKKDDKVYTVTGAEGENLDAKPTKKKKAAKKPTIDSLFAEQEAAEQAAAAEQEKDQEPTADNQEAEKPAPKKRGRKSKKELEAEQAAKAAEEPAEEQATDIPEAANAEPSEPIEEQLISQLKEKMWTCPSRIRPPFHRSISSTAPCRSSRHITSLRTAFLLLRAVLTASTSRSSSAVTACWKSCRTATDSYAQATTTICRHPTIFTCRPSRLRSIT